MIAGQLNVTVSREGVIDSVLLHPQIEILEAYTAPTKSDIVSKVKIFDYQEEMFGAYKGCQFKTYDLIEILPNVFTPVYLFRVNQPDEVLWNYDICMLDADVNRMALAGMLPDPDDQ